MIVQFELMSLYFVLDCGVSDKYDNEGKRQCEYYVVKEDGEFYNFVGF